MITVEAAQEPSDELSLPSSACHLPANARQVELIVYLAPNPRWSTRSFLGAYSHPSPRIGEMVISPRMSSCALKVRRPFIAQVRT